MSDSSERRREHNTLELSLRKREETDLLESLRENDSLKSAASAKRRLLDHFQPASVLKNHFFQVLAILKCKLLDLRDALGDNDFAYVLVLI